MKLTTHRPSPAMIVALLGLFVALGGVGVAATGDNFILGQSNTADAQSALTGNAGTNAQLKVQNNGGGPAIAAVANDGVPPLKVSSSTKIGGLNADLLDGKDSVEFLPSHGDLNLGAMAIDARAVSPGLSFSFNGTNGNTIVHSSTTGDKTVLVPFQVPTTLFGHPLALTAMRVCFKSAGASFITQTAAVIRQPPATSARVDDTNHASTTEICYDPDVSNGAVIKALFAKFVLHFTAIADVIELIDVEATLTTVF